MFRPLFINLLPLLVGCLPPHSGQVVSSFVLQTVDGGEKQVKANTGEIRVVIFVGDRCPMSNGFNSRINDLYNELHNRVEFLVINSNANETIEDVGAHARAMEYDFPVYKDVRNTAADLFGAQFTPEAFVVDRSGTIAYQGYIEDAPNPARVKHRALREAIQALLEGKSVPVPRTHGLGCSIRRPHSN